MNTPNKLTAGRIIATPVFMATMLINFPYHYTVSMLIFILASLTDLIDGKMARKYNLVTDFGKFLDPLADKMLTTAAYLGFIYLFKDNARCCIIVTVVLFIVLFREFMVSSIRLVTVTSGGKVIAANIWGKAKTMSQMVGLTVALFVYALSEFVDFSKFKSVWIISDYLIMGLFCLSGVLCVISGAIYLVGSKDCINPSK